VSTTIDTTEFYIIKEPTFMCCDQSQFRYYCKSCDEFMGCQFCAFDPYAPCECVTYCERCNENFDNEGFDHRFDFPICLTCADKYCIGCHKGDSEPATHQLFPQGNKCCECAECPNLTCAKAQG